MRKGEPICVLETSKASVELDAPDEGTLFQLYRAGAEVELGGTIALLARSDDDRTEAARRRSGRPAVEERRPEQSRATRKAVELAEQHGIDLDAIDKQGFITTGDVEALIAAGARDGEPAAAPGPLADVSLDGVTLPGIFATDEAAGALDAGFLAYLRSDPAEFRALASDEKVARYREHGASVGADIVLEEGVLLVAPRIVLEHGVRIGRGGTIRCLETIAIGALTSFQADLELTCRRAFLGANVWAARRIQIGGGGAADPWATLVIGDLTFLGEEIFVNVCRPVVIGREVFLTMRSMIVTHNVGHSILEGYENRFAPVVLEDRAQVGMGTVVYAGTRIGRDAIVASNSYVVSDIPAEKLAIGVPAKAVAPSHRSVPRPRQVELARTLVDELAERIRLGGHDVTPVRTGDEHGFELATEDGPARVSFVETLRRPEQVAAGDGTTVVLALELGDFEPPAEWTVIELLQRRIQGPGGMVVDTVREYCRKKGIRLEPIVWRYRGGLI